MTNAQPTTSAGTVAIIGASADPSKYGNKAVRAYLRQGYTVYPVNPRGGSVIEGQPVYARIEDIPGPIDRITLYVPPEIGLGLLPAIQAKAPRELFVNPGAESAAFMEEAERLGLAPIYACSIVDIGERP